MGTCLIFMPRPRQTEQGPSHTHTFLYLDRELNTMVIISLRILAIIPLLPPLYILIQLIYSDLIIISGDSKTKSSTESSRSSSVGASELGVFLALGILGHVVTHRLIPNIQHYMLKRGISGKDLGKKGTKNEHVDM